MGETKDWRSRVWGGFCLSGQFGLGNGRGKISKPTMIVPKTKKKKKKSGWPERSDREIHLFRCRVSLCSPG